MFSKKELEVIEYALEVANGNCIKWELSNKYERLLKKTKKLISEKPISKNQSPGLY